MSQCDSLDRALIHWEKGVWEKDVGDNSSPRSYDPVLTPPACVARALPTNAASNHIRRVLATCRQRTAPLDQRGPAAGERRGHKDDCPDGGMRQGIA